MGLSAIHASTMIGDMSMSTDMDMDGAGRMDCNACGGTGEEGMQAGDCSAVCVGQALALPLAGSTDTTLHSRQPLLPPSELLVGRLSAPDPHPPKTIDLA